MHAAEESHHFVLCFQVHQPRRISSKSIEDRANECFDDDLNRAVMERVAARCYIPTNELLLRLLDKYPNLRFTFGISGTAIEQMELFAPDALKSFQDLAQTGAVDFLSEPHYHSLSFLMEGEEFEIQILEHAEKIYEHFQARPAVFRNTNLIYNDEIGRRISMMGFSGVLIEVQDRLNPHFLYEHRDGNALRLLMRNARLSDDIAFRVASSAWRLTAEAFMSWLEEMPANERLATVALDYETFGEHHAPETGIFDFLERLLLMLAMQNDYRMITAADAVTTFSPRHAISVPDYSTVHGCDLYDWIGNDRQREAFSAINDLEMPVKKLQDPLALKTWRSLQTGDHLFYMSDKAAYCNLSPFRSPQDAFHHFMEAVQWIRNRIDEIDANTEGPRKLNETLELERRNINTPVWALSIDPQHGHNH